MMRHGFTGSLVGPAIARWFMDIGVGTETQARTAQAYGGGMGLFGLGEEDSGAQVASSSGFVGLCACANCSRCPFSPENWC